MSSLINPGLIYYRRMFSLLIAPSNLLAEGLNTYLKKEYRDVLIISGEVPFVLSRIQPGKFKLKVERVSSGQEVYETLQRTKESLIIIEHDPGFYDNHADLIRAIALLARKKVTGTQTIFLLGTRADAWLNKFETYVHKAITIDMPGVDNRTGSPHSPMRSNQIRLPDFLMTEARVS
ncbi:hypothetical protein [uncultured Methanospirillum sp.]|uniref:hypothetical protein n=1 Tax=uncultured Methanospirillum sp. TaxID=262503 RepID=UPI0029C622B8|nr:hypothetical protein [uncultured Methanospirillum sp.]